MKLFSLAYSLLIALLYVAVLPILLFLSLKSKYKISIPARFFLKENPPFKNSGIWFHVCSFGEAKALKPILNEISKDKQINISVITTTGFNEAKKYNADVRYLPFELFLPFWVKKQEKVVILEAEFWYLLFAVMAYHGSEIILLNARISEKSFPKYKKFGWFYKKVFAYVTKAYVQSEDDKKRFEYFGLKNIEVSGNIKLAQKIVATRFFEKLSSVVITAASTHEGEEEPILEAFVKYKEIHDAKLIIVPRHPERFEIVYNMLKVYAKKYNLTYSRWSNSENFEADIILMDVMGELNNIYVITDIAILGGGFNKKYGGHNPLEPASFGCKIISGKNVFNQKELFKYVKNVQFVEPDKIHEALINAALLEPSSVEEKINLKNVIEHLNKVDINGK
jgi:3-deoxy-D-manno-octulosonic-acid transferase